jgi:hypothetical protein
MKWFDLCERSSSTPIVNQRTQSKKPPGVQSEMLPIPDCGEHSYIGSGTLRGKTAVITGGDSGIGRAVSIAFAREGADVLIAYLHEGEGARSAAAVPCSQTCRTTASERQGRCWAMVNRASSRRHFLVSIGRFLHEH